MKKSLAILMFTVFFAVLCTGCKASTPSTPSGESSENNATETAPSYPIRDIRCVVPFGAGGGTDLIAREMAGLVQKNIGKGMVVENVGGASGSVGMQTVFNAPTDGYTIAFASETMMTFNAMKLVDLDYDDFDFVNLFAVIPNVLVTSPDSPYKSFDDVIKAAKANPGKVTVATTGAGTVTDIAFSLMEKIHGVKFNKVAFNGSGEAVTAILGKQVDLYNAGMHALGEYVRSGKMIPLVAFANEPVPAGQGMADIPAVSSLYPEYKGYMPCGPFFGAMVKTGTPKDIEDKLVEEFAKAWKSDEFQKYLKESNFVPLGLSGEEARTYVKNLQSKFCWMLYEMGITDVEPSTYGVAKPQS
ncbi:Bug family tripartite tricarboxylate transporter substrate binding protein [Candidatus Formimonas warabiya]|uniref:Tripartite tricarboxylate transporter substrate binding protein n=1 Tax=Formimonas warabiya TaxID=1761012 RepID=A0A3G1KNG9_FORW1|nr:tripartite tricarboxylate transporter substrate binding protein [Candidatus Formimonas warabiya]ATW24008.1 hypothetical protein DCMF_03660 [Candidatus Formimonas warabiya]